MVQYKCVPGPIGLVIQNNQSYASAVRSYADIIQREAVGGWEFFLIQEIPVTKDKGCLAGCLSFIGWGSQYETINFNMLVFKKED